jgi:RHS repeat-associated protein
LDLVVGVDVHFEMVPMPAPTPTPFPHPFVGMIGDLKALATNLIINNVIGMAMAGELQPPKGPVLINLLPATNTGTDCKNKNVLPHFVIPPGTMWTPMPKAPKPKIGLHEAPPPDPPVAPAGDAVLMMGSKTVTLMGSNAVRFGDLAMSCSEPLRLPSSTVMAIPKGPPVLIGGPPAIDWVQAAGALLRSKWVANELHGLVSRIKNIRLQNLLTRAVCFLTGHPVDVASGHVLTWATDWSLPGTPPLVFERSYSTGWSGRRGVLGHGWSHTLDEAVWTERGRVVYRSGDGREIEFDTFPLAGHVMRHGDELWEPLSRLSLHCDGPGAWTIRSAADGVVRRFETQAGKGGGPTSRLVSLRGRSGHHVHLQYDADARLEWVRDIGGRMVHFEHDRSGRLIRVSLPHPSQDGWLLHNQYRYSEDDDLIAVVDAAGHETRFEYQDHLLVRETDRNGLSFYFGYDGTGPDARCVRTWGDDGIYDQELLYDPANGTTFVTDGLDHTTTYFANPLGAVVKVVNPLGAETSYEYDDCLRIVKRTDPTGVADTYAYDARGNCTRVERAGAVVVHEYDAQDRELRRISASGRERRFVRDGDGTLRAAVEANGNTTRYDYQDGRIAACTGPDGARTRFQYDAAGNMTRVDLASGASVTTEYDRLGRVVGHRNAAGARSWRTYDSVGRLATLVDVDGSRFAFERDPEGNVTRADAPARGVRFGYWGKGRVAWREIDGQRTSLRFDAEGRPIELRNDGGEQARFAFDAAGRLASETGFDGGVRRYRRDAKGRIVALEKPSGATLRFRYDDWGRRVAVSYPGGEDRYAYAPDGGLVRASNADADVEWERDVLGRVISEKSGDDVVLSTYGKDGLRSAVQSSLGLLERIQRGPHHRPVALKVSWGPTRTAVRFERDATGREIGRALPGGVEVRWTRDTAGRPIERTVARAGLPLESERYHWDGPALLGTIVNSQRGTRRIIHDQRGFAVEEQRSDRRSVVRSVDACGNPHVATAAGARDREYGAGGRLRRDGPDSYQHDADGNIIARETPEGAWRYTYDGLGRIKLVVRPDGRETSFRYDALGRRIAKDGGHAKTRWIWDGHRTLHELSTEQKPCAWLREPDGHGVLMRAERDGVTVSVPDLVGASAALFDGKGQSLWMGDLTLYGRPAPAALPSLWPWRFPGQYHDNETGLHYNRFRYYDPQTGRYLSPDPLGLLGGLNAYAYCRDPFTQIDPFGLSECGPFENHMPDQLEQELADAERLGVTPMRPGDPGFDELVNSGRVKWAVNENGELLFIPHTVGDTEIAHSVLTGGNPVLAAGEADIAGAGSTFIATDVTRQSGHFQPSEGSLDTGVAAMRDSGIQVPPSSVNPTIER